MALSERQAALMRLMTTKHDSLTLLCAKTISQIMEAPESERPGLLETFLYGWAVAYDERQEPNTDTYEIDGDELATAQLQFIIMTEDKTLRGIKALDEGRPASEVAEVLAQDLKALRSYGLTAQLVLFSVIVNGNYLPYLGNDELHVGDRKTIQGLFRRISQENPRLMAICFVGLDKHTFSISELVCVVDSILTEECQNRDQRLYLLGMVMEHISKSNRTRSTSDISKAGKQSDQPVNLKNAN